MYSLRKKVLFLALFVLVGCTGTSGVTIQDSGKPETGHLDPKAGELPPQGVAGGDLSGFYPNPRVAALVDGGSPGYVLTWNGSVWSAAVPPGGGDGGAPTGAAGGDLYLTYPNPGVKAIRGENISDAGPDALGQLLAWNGNSWTPEGTTPSAGQVPTWSGSQWLPATPATSDGGVTGITALTADGGIGGGDIIATGPGAVPGTVVGLYGAPLNSNVGSPVAPNVLTYSSTGGCGGSCGAWIAGQVQLNSSTAVTNILQASNGGFGANTSGVTPGWCAVFQVGGYWNGQPCPGSGGGVSWGSDLILSTNTNQYVSSLTGGNGTSGTTSNTVVMNADNFSHPSSNTFEISNGGPGEWISVGSLLIESSGAQIQMTAGSFITLNAGSGTSLNLQVGGTTYADFSSSVSNIQNATGSSSLTGATGATVQATGSGANVNITSSSGQTVVTSSGTLTLQSTSGQVQETSTGAMALASGGNFSVNSSGSASVTGTTETLTTTVGALVGTSAAGISFTAGGGGIAKFGSSSGDVALNSGSSSGVYIDNNNTSYMTVTPTGVHGSHLAFPNATHVGTVVASACMYATINGVDICILYACPGASCP